ncbi:hypothetical protein UA08_01146 [Talaromyces atroroseus]|uniref:Zn(2)-C6 fungal-type domain-containing protein n=1 Tax=Talaromyces atroroseus TaxID=1441469 RepID=A0A1Q5QB86_TALAT|nr:hypothetical protein UA08_01146 [Talaromyces atroroseus]OKL63202.1 hypothetical protein UA08_01146 [Talaromyces atroroseus]
MFTSYNLEDKSGGSYRIPKLNMKKSRFGCQRCKTRRVKCDEAKPKCQNCKRHGATCVYLGAQPKRQTPKGSHSGATSYSDLCKSDVDLVDPPESRERRLLEARLMCQYVRKTAESISIDDFSRSVYTKAVLELCFQNDAMLYGMYSMAALDQARCSQEDDTVASLDIHRRYLSMALRHHQNDLGNITTDNIDAICVTSSIFRAFAFGLLQHRTLQPYSPPIEWLTLAKTAVAVFTEAYDIVKDKPNSIAWQCLKQVTTFEVPKASSERGYEDLKYLLQRDAEDARTEAWDDEVREAYEWAVRFFGDLRGAAQSGMEEGQICRRLIIFPMFMHDRLVGLIRDAEPRSLVLLAHYFAYLVSFEHIWWIGTAGVQEHFFPQNPSFSYEAMRAAGVCNFGGADLGEVISICSRIPSGNEDRWLQEWRSAADRAATNARISLSKGNKPGARDAFLRASNYYRTAEFYRREDPVNDELSKTLSELCSAMFFSAVEQMPYTLEKVSIPYEGTTLPGIFVRSNKAQTPAPTLILNGGFDSVKEEVCLTFGAPALELGFNVLAFDGPGQGEALRQQKLVFRHDWEKVITPVMDYTLSRPDVDQTKVFLYGISMGGYLVPRAVAYEHRAAAIILNDGIYDFGSAFRNQSFGIGKFLADNHWDATFKTLARLIMRRNTGFKWALLNGQWVYGLPEAGILRESDKYTLEGIVGNIKTPALILDAPDDHFLKGQPEELYKRLECEKTLVQLTRDEGASLHCHIGSAARLNQVVGDYLMERIS